MNKNDMETMYDIVFKVFKIELNILKLANWENLSERVQSVLN